MQGEKKNQLGSVQTLTTLNKGLGYLTFGGTKGLLEPHSAHTHNHCIVH